MPNMKIITVITLVLMASVYFLHVSFITKLLLDLLLFAGWAFFAIVRSASERRRARQSSDNV
ncbi:hypothetical protein [Methylocystis echinoides]|jgi:hypothetical protein|uniref:hypothetical protein n=1 Tax=Methylocystis echinoides TaxID=29468 RepID=UPI003431AE6D